MTLDSLGRKFQLLEYSNLPSKFHFSSNVLLISEKGTLTGRGDQNGWGGGGHHRPPSYLVKKGPDLYVLKTRVYI